jgi:hypothetical protein
LNHICGNNNDVFSRVKLLKHQVPPNVFVKGNVNENQGIVDLMGELRNTII